MKISEAALQSGLSIDTIRYYERAGLVPAIARGADGVRRFSPKDLEWLVLLGHLRQTGMPLATMERFAAAYAQGDQTVPERRAILLEHQARLDARRAELERCAALLAKKLDLYDTLEIG
jgi:DNA-binding transcriptional MerR regulator